MILNEEIIVAAKNLSDLIKADPRYVAACEAGKAYSDDPGLSALLIEYQAQQTALADLYSKDERDDGIIDAIQTRLSEIYAAVIGHPLYVAYKEASDEYQAFYKSVYDEIEFNLTGKRADGCTHDCSTCSGCH